MRVIAKSDAEAWCDRHKITLNERKLPDRSAFPSKFAIPADAGQRVNLVNRSMEAFRGEPELLIWFTDWGVWPSGERMHIFERLRKSYDEGRRLIDAPAHICEAGEIEDSISFVTTAVLFLWDCYIMVENGEKLLFFSHDEYGLTNLY